MKPLRREFSEWWPSLLSRWSDSRDGYDIIDSAAAFLSRLSPEERRPFLDGLVTVAEDRSDGDALAIDLLKLFAEPPHATRIYALAKTSPPYETPQEESYLVSLLRVVASKGSDSEQDVVDAYFGHVPLPRYYSSLQWSLWPGRPDSFGRTYARFLVEIPHERWEHTAVVQAFMRDPHALTVVRRVLAGTETLQHLDRAVSRQLTLGLWSEDEKQAISVALTHMA